MRLHISVKNRKMKELYLRLDFRHRGLLVRSELRLSFGAHEEPIS